MNNTRKYRILLGCFLYLFSQASGTLFWNMFSQRIYEQTSIENPEGASFYLGIF